MISNFRRVLNVVCFLLGNSPASELYMPTFRNTLSHLYTYPPIKMDQTECSETSAYKIQTPGNYPEESIQHNFKKICEECMIAARCQILHIMLSVWGFLQLMENWILWTKFKVWEKWFALCICYLSIYCIVICFQLKTGWSESLCLPLQYQLGMLNLVYFFRSISRIF